MVAIYKPFVWWMTKKFGHHKSQKRKYEKETLTVYWPTAKAKLGDGYFDITHAPVTLKPEAFIDEDLAAIKANEDNKVSLSFRIRRAGALPWARWRVQVMRADKIKLPDGKEMDASLDQLERDDGFKTVYKMSGLGLPPEELTLNGIIPKEDEVDAPGAWKVDPEKVYRLRISAETIYGDKLVSNPMNAKVGAVDENLTSEETQKMTVSDAFDGETKELREALLQNIDQMVKDLNKDDNNLRVIVHTNDNGDEAADLLTSEQISLHYYDNFEKAGIAKERIKAKPMGAKEMVDPDSVNLAQRKPSCCHGNNGIGRCIFSDAKINPVKNRW